MLIVSPASAGLFYKLCCMKKLILFLGIFWSLVTHAAISVRADIPAVLHTGDYIEIPVHIFNGNDQEATGQIQFLLVNSRTKKSVDGWMQNVFPVQHYSVSEKLIQTLAFPIRVPMQVDFKSLSFYVVVGTDTINVGKSNIQFIPPNVNPGIRISQSVRVFRNDEEISLSSGESFAVSDTITIVLKSVTDKKFTPRSIDIESAANILPLGEAQTIRKMNILIRTQRFVVTHKGSCTSVVTARANGSSRTAYSDFIIRAE